MFAIKERKALFEIFKAGSLENVELAIQLANNSDVNLCLPHFEALFDYLIELKALNYPLETPLAKKVHHILTTEVLDLKIETEELSVIPASIYLLKNLKKLSIVAHIETYIPHTISYFEVLEELELCLLDQEKLPSAIFEIQSLIKLDLSFNLFEELPREIWQLRNLVELNLLSCINLSNVPNELFGLPKLETVILLNTSINEISPSIAYSNIQKYIVEFDNEGKKVMANPKIGKKMLLNTGDQKTKVGKAFAERLKSANFLKNKPENIPPKIKAQGLDSIKEYLKGKI